MIILYHETTHSYQEVAMENYKKKKIFITLLIAFVILSFILGIIQFIRSIPPKELISTETYDIYELTVKDNRIYFSFIDDEKKINKNHYPTDTIFRNLYLGEKNQVTIEKWGRNGKITKVKFIKFHLDEDTYKKFSKEFQWEYGFNM